MLINRIAAYENKNLVLEGIMVEADSNKALKKFEEKYPTYKNCIVKATQIDTEEHKEYIEMCMKLGCIY